MTNVKYWKVDELCDLWMVSKRTVYEYLETGRLVGLKFGHGWRVREEDRLNFEKTLIRR